MTAFQFWCALNKNLFKEWSSTSCPTSCRVNIFERGLRFSLWSEGGWTAWANPPEICWCLATVYSWLNESRPTRRRWKCICRSGHDCQWNRGILRPHGEIEMILDECLGGRYPMDPTLLDWCPKGGTCESATREAIVEAYGKAAYEVSWTGRTASRTGLKGCRSAWTSTEGISRSNQVLFQNEIRFFSPIFRQSFEVSIELSSESVIPVLVENKIRFRFLCICISNLLCMASETIAKSPLFRLKKIKFAFAPFSCSFCFFFFEFVTPCSTYLRYQAFVPWISRTPSYY